MNFETFYNLDKLIARAEQEIDRVEVVSFDLFDTLLIRRAHNPDQLKEPVARFIAARARQAGINRPWNRVLRFRNKVEAMHRRRSARKFTDHEARYPDFMTDVLARIFNKHSPEQIANLLKEVTDYELSIESSMIVPRAAFVRLLKTLKQKRKRVLAISDVYLPSEHLKQLVANAGLGDLIDEVISSADSFHAKASGEGWTLVREKYPLDPAKWLHIGDNPISDGLRPSEIGIKALVLRDASESWRKQIVKTYTQISRTRPYWRGRLVQQLMLPLEGENVPRDYLYTTGYNFFAPLFCSFVHRTVERCRELGIKRVYFFSREGEMFLKIWKRIVPVLFPEGDVPEAHYLHVSRFALASASCAHRGLSLENAQITFLPATNKDMRDLCRVFSLEIEPLIPIMRRFNIGPDDTLSRLHAGWSVERRNRFARMLEDEDFQNEIRRQARPANDALQLYLQQERFFDQPEVGLIDIGWLGTIQRFLGEAVSHRADKPRFHGFVFAAAGGYLFPTTYDNMLEGIVFDRQRFDFAGSLVLYALEIFEESCRAKHPGLLGYVKKGDGFGLKFRDENDPVVVGERRQSESFAQLHEGILDAAARYGAAAAVAGYEAKEMKPWLNVTLVNRLAFPTAGEVAGLKHVFHSNDFSGGHVPLRRFRKVQQKLWTSAPWKLRCVPFLRTWFYIKHAVHSLRTC